MSLQFEENLVNKYENLDHFIYNFESKSHKQSNDIKYLINKIELEKFLSKLKQSIRVIEQSFERFSTDELCLSFNGGKDCCIVLYLFYAVAKRLNIKFPLKVLLIQIENEFNEMKQFKDFLMDSFHKNSFEYITYNNCSIKKCLEQLKETNSSIKNILIGTRRSDNSYFHNMAYFAPTDNDWPSFMRINPILDWSYNEVWYFLKKLELPYCVLYDQGYTSIDSTKNTIKNISLLKLDGTTYLPAFMLEKQEFERNSRKKIE